jgi:hypothetical protein
LLFPLWGGGGGVLCFLDLCLSLLQVLSFDLNAQLNSQLTVKVKINHNLDYISFSQSRILVAS